MPFTHFILAGIAISIIMQINNEAIIASRTTYYIYMSPFRITNIHHESFIHKKIQAQSNLTTLVQSS